MKKKIYGAPAPSLLAPVLAIMAAALALAGCAKSDTPADSYHRVELAAALGNGAQAATARPSSANLAPPTRTADGGDSWEAGDPIGLFMLEGGGTLPGGIITVKGTRAHNREYRITDPLTGALAPGDGGDLWYPQTGTVDFIAYYPYGAAGTGPGEVTADYKYTVSVADQSDPAAIDLMWAKADRAPRSKTAVELSFEHRLSKITLNLTAGDGITPADISGMAAGDVSVSGMPTGASFGLQDGDLAAYGSPQPFTMYREATATPGYDATFTAILLPQGGGGYPGRKVTFTVGGEGFIWNIPDNTPFGAGENNVFPVTIRRTGVSVGSAAITAWDDTDPATVGITEPKL